MFEQATRRHTRTRGQARAVLRLCLLSLLLCVLPDVAQSAIYSCATPDGGQIFQDRPCPIEKSRDIPVARPQRLPFDIHESWFEIPEQAPDRAYCDRHRCECGDLVREFNGSLDLAVADALYMDGSWHRYETSYRLREDAPTNSSRRLDLHEQMKEAACNIMISQQLLREYAEEVTERLRRKARTAEEYGYDQPGPCLQQVRKACSHLEAVELLHRLLSDARALHKVRTR